MELIEALNWRYATKRMIDKKVSEDDVHTILEAIRLTPTAYGLQPFNIIITDNEKVKEEIFEIACPQVVVKQCSHLILFKTNKSIDYEYVEHYLNEMRNVRNATDEYIENYRKKIQRVVDTPEINRFSWMIHQTYIALGFACMAAAQLGIDTTPIEGFNPDALNKYLNLNTEKEEITLLLTLGYRNEEEDSLSKKTKIRKPMDIFVEKI